MELSADATDNLQGMMLDLQGSWICLRGAVADMPPSDLKQQLISHIDEGMSRTDLRVDLDSMYKTLILISDIANQADVGEEVAGWLQDVKKTFEEVKLRVISI